jgi:hypothetical protein
VHVDGVRHDLLHFVEDHVEVDVTSPHKMPFITLADAGMAAHHDEFKVLLSRYWDMKLQDPAFDMPAHETMFHAAKGMHAAPPGRDGQQAERAPRFTSDDLDETRAFFAAPPAAEARKRPRRTLDVKKIVQLNGDVVDAPVDADTAALVAAAAAAAGGKANALRHFQTMLAGDKYYKLSQCLGSESLQNNGGILANVCANLKFTVTNMELAIVFRYGSKVLWKPKIGLLRFCLGT